MRNVCDECPVYDIQRSCVAARIGKTLAMVAKTIYLNLRISAQIRNDLLALARLNPFDASKCKEREKYCTNVGSIEVGFYFLICGKKI